MKRILKMITITIITLLIIFIILIPFVNNYSAARVVTKLEKISMPEKTTYIESICNAGKLVGNGNGMQYFGAILIKSELSIDELKEFYSDYSDSEFEVHIEEQKGQQIELIEHRELLFDHKFDENVSYYMLYSWGNGIEPFNSLDIRGH